MKELLELCGFKTDELAAQLPRIERVFNRLGITPEDIERAKQRLHTYFDIDLEGIRKSLRLYVLEVVDLMLAKEEGKKKILYGFMTGGCFEAMSYALMASSKEVYSARIDFLFQRLLGYIFGKMNQVMEAAEQQWVKAGGVTHCGNVKSIVGLYALDWLPKPDLMVAAGGGCETAPKTVELINELYDVPTGYFGNYYDIGADEPPEAISRAVDLSVKDIRKLSKRIRDVVGFEITSDTLREAIYARKKLSDANRRLGELLISSDSLPIRPTAEMIVGSYPVKMDDVPLVIDAVDTLYEEVQERINKGIKVVEEGAPRILTTHPLHASDPRLEHLLTEMGIIIARPSFGPPPPMPFDEKENDPYVMMGGTVPMGSLSGKLDMIVELCKKYNVDGLLDVYHAGCRGMVGDAIFIKEAVEREVGIPALLIQWENFDPRVYNHDQYQRQLEVFKNMMIERNM